MAYCLIVRKRRVKNELRYDSNNIGRDYNIGNPIFGAMVVELKKYVIRCNYCGATHTRWEWWLKLKTIFGDRIYHTCSVCHHTSCYRYFFRLVHDSTDGKERTNNKNKLWDDRM